MLIHFLKYSKVDQKLIEKAVSFLVSNYNSTGHNEKPVILHSLRVAFYLMEAGVEIEVIIAAILHDLVEDTDVSINEIKTEFGDNVASTVAAVSFNSDIEDYESQYKETFNRSIEQGTDSLLVKAADILDNSDYYSFAPADLQSKLWQKANYFLKISEPIIGSRQIWQDLKSRMIKARMS